MKKTTRLVHVDAYQDDEGKPVCGGRGAGPRCVHLGWDGDWMAFMSTLLCQYQRADKPGPTCPVWHGESKGE